MPSIEQRTQVIESHQDQVESRHELGSIQTVLDIGLVCHDIDFWHKRLDGIASYLPSPSINCANLAARYHSIPRLWIGQCVVCETGIGD
jgi:hypothetical protein